MDRRVVHKLCLAAALCWSTAAIAVGADNSDSYREQRRAFQSALNALDRGDLPGYRRVERLLRDYPLYPYLRYEYLRPRLSSAAPEDVRTFLADHGDTPIAEQLRRAWLSQLARQERWEAFLEDHVPGLGTGLQCQSLTARIQTGADDAVWDEIDALWLSGGSQPDECDAPFAAWRQAGHMSRDKVLARMELAMQRGQTGLVNYLAGFLPKSDRSWVARWQRVHRSPEAELRRLAPEPEPFWSAKLFTYGVRRLAERDAEVADRYWAKHAEYGVTPDQAARVERAVAIGLALQRHPDALHRLDDLAAGQSADRDVRQWRVRAALWQRDWERTLTALNDLPASEQAEEEWQYWRGRALDALGRSEEARAHFESAATQRSFWGFLAAGRLARAPNITTVPVDVTPDDVVALQMTPAMQRIRELNALHMTVEAKREWREALASLDTHGLRVAAKLAHQWGWHDQAIIALGRTDYMHDLELRFPTPFEQEVTRAAEKRGLDPAFVFAVMRQESAFGVEARSPVGALGLMQLMPETARRTARSHKLPKPSRADMLKAEHNIRLGTAYLSDLLDRYKGNRVFALAAYNAGPTRVERWRPSTEPMEADIWVANITYGETREYVQRILAYTAIYEWRLGREVTPMHTWLQEAPPRLIREAADSTKKPAPG